MQLETDDAEHGDDKPKPKPVFKSAPLKVSAARDPSRATNALLPLCAHPCVGLEGTASVRTHVLPLHHGILRLPRV